jgi:aminoglycoside phosphotransferase (APT) family kinase protein
MRDALQAWLGDQVGAPVLIERMERISTGHSRAMYRLELSRGDPLVVRIEQGGVFGTGGPQEHRVMAALGRVGFPVAPVLWSEPTGEIVGQPFFVMEFVPGDDRGREDRSLEIALASDLLTALARLHELATPEVLDSFDTVPSPGEATHVQIDRWAETYRQVASQQIPLLDEAAAWLHRHAPPLDRLHVVHGDPGPGNLISSDGQVVALTDWEFAHLGDPMEDWVYLMAMRGARAMSQAEWVDLIEEVTGVAVTETDRRYWAAFSFFKGACANRTAVEVFRTHKAAPNLAIIGTALHQTFLRQLSDLVATP